MLRRNLLKTIMITTLSITMLTACNKNVSTLPEGTSQVPSTEMTTSVEEQPTTTEVASEKTTKATGGASKEQPTTSSTKGTSQVSSTEETAPVQSTEEVASSNPTVAPTTTSNPTETTSSANSSTEQPTVAPTTTEQVEETAPVQSTEETTSVIAKEETTTKETPSEQSTEQPTTTAPKETAPVQSTEEVASSNPIEQPTVAPHVHSYTSTVTKTATCTEEGITTFTCSCGDGYTETIPTLSHSFGEYIYNNDATTENDGTKTATCSVCGTTDTIVAEGTKLEGTTYPALPTEHCPYPVNTIIDNGDGTYSMYYVDTGLTMDKYGISDGFVGNNAGNDFMTFCDKNYLYRAFDCYIGDYAEGCISWICGQPY